MPNLRFSLGLLQLCSETRIFSQLCCREHFLSVQYAGYCSLEIYTSSHPNGVKTVTAPETCLLLLLLANDVITAD